MAEGSIVVLTFDHPHRKTQDLIFHLLAKGVKPSVVATEWEVRKNFQPLITHRPSNPVDVSLSDFCNNMGIQVHFCKKSNLYETLSGIDQINYILLATGNLISEDITERYKVINSHPGYLPDIKGLDALKWAVYHDEKVGVTTHFIDGEIDGGVIIERRHVPIYPEDTFHNVAYRQYEMEVSMLVNSIFIEPLNLKVQESSYKTFRRMPHRLEHEMISKFDRRKKYIQQ